MLTDDTLTDLLRRSFADATESVVPSGDLVTTLHRKHSAAQRRRVATRVAVPAVAAVSVSAALAAPQHRATHRAPLASRASTPLAITPRTVAPVSYRVAFPQRLGTLGCVPRPTAPDATAWIYADGTCRGEAAAVIVTNAQRPTDAQPVTIGTLKDLYSVTSGSIRTIYARNANGTFTSVTVNVSTPDLVIESFFTPAS